MRSQKRWFAAAVIGGICMAVAPILTASAQDAEHEEMMQAWMEIGTPNEHHAFLGSWVGEWQLESTYWMDPDAPAEHSTAYSEAEMILDGRYLAEKVHGDMEMPTGEMFHFEGHALVGYDNVKEKYFSHWIDNMSTSVMTEWGKVNDEGQMVTKGKIFNPMYGKEIKTKSIATIVNDTTRKLEMWMEHPEKGMFKHMEIVYTRR